LKKLVFGENYTTASTFRKNKKKANSITRPNFKNGVSRRQRRELELVKRVWMIISYNYVSERNLDLILMKTRIKRLAFSDYS
jgi:hypothetical protein